MLFAGSFSFFIYFSFLHSILFSGFVLYPHFCSFCSYIFKISYAEYLMCFSRPSLLFFYYFSFQAPPLFPHLACFFQFFLPLSLLHHPLYIFPTFRCTRIKNIFEYTFSFKFQPQWVFNTGRKNSSSHKNQDGNSHQRLMVILNINFLQVLLIFLASSLMRWRSGQWEGTALE